MNTKTLLKVALISLALLIFAPGVSAVANTVSTPNSKENVEPYILDSDRGGNIKCGQINEGYFGDKVNYEDGEFEGPFPDGITPTVGADGIYVSWISNTPIVAVIVKGSNDANIYPYYNHPDMFAGDPPYSDSGLASPVVNKKGKHAELSNLTFCFEKVDENDNGNGDTPPPDNGDNGDGDDNDKDEEKDDEIIEEEPEEEVEEEITEEVEEEKTETTEEDKDAESTGDILGTAASDSREDEILPIGGVLGASTLAATNGNSAGYLYYLILVLSYASLAKGIYSYAREV